MKKRSKYIYCQYCNQISNDTDAVWSEAISVYDYDYTSCAYTQSTKLLHSVAILN